MKKIIIFCTFIGFATTVFGQNVIKTLIVFEMQQDNKTFTGLKNTNGKIIIPAKYLGILLHEDYALAEDYNGDYTYIDSTGKIIGTYAMFSDFHSGVSVVTKFANSNDREESKGVYGLMDKTGKFIVAFGVYSSYQYRGFEDGYCVVTKEEINEPGVKKYGLINSKGTVILEPIFKSVKKPSDGMVAIQDAKTKLWGFTNLKGEITIPPVYFWVNDFRNGYADVDTEGVFKGRIKIDKTGKEVK